MKKDITGIIIAALIILGFTAGGFGKNQPVSSMPALSIEKTLSSNANPNIVVLDAKSTQDDSIFSLYTIISLGFGVIGIATFRGNILA